MKRLLAIGIAGLGLLTGAVLAQTVKQGDPTKPTDPTEFQSPMVIETVFAPADPTRWVSDEWTPQNPKRWKDGEFTLPEYHALGKFVCDGVPIRQNYSKRKGTWQSGLSMWVRPLPRGEVEVKVQVTIENSGLIHDKFVTFRLEVLNGDERVGDATIKIKSSTSWKHSTEDYDGEVKMVLGSDSLKKDPITKLRITMTTKDY